MTIEDTSSPTKCPITTRLVLETNEGTKEPVLEVDKKLIRKLKPHQVDGAYCGMITYVIVCVCWEFTASFVLVNVAVRNKFLFI